MNVNDHFNDFPIDYFKIKPEDFLDPIGLDPEDLTRIYTYEESSLSNYILETLDLDERGFVGESLRDKLDFTETDTTVVNCAVGQGKTTAILNKLKEEYDRNSQAVFIIAVPLVSLILQYKRDLINLGVSEDDIFDYSYVGRNSLEDIVYRSDTNYQYNKILKRIHLVTVNTLLGNAGKDAVMQSDAKFEYVKFLADKLSGDEF